MCDCCMGFIAISLSFRCPCTTFVSYEQLKFDWARIYGGRTYQRFAIWLVLNLLSWAFENKDENKFIIWRLPIILSVLPDDFVNFLISVNERICYEAKTSLLLLKSLKFILLNFALKLIHKRKWIRNLTKTWWNRGIFDISRTFDSCYFFCLPDLLEFLVSFIPVHLLNMKREDLKI